MSIILRPYQEQAKVAIRKALSTGMKNPLACLPTGSGKTPVITSLLHELSQRFPDERFVCAVHTQELVDQLARTYERIAGIRPAVYSASLKRRELGPVVFAQVQSIHRKACDFGRVKLLVIDECDRVPLEGDGQYRTFIKESTVINPDLRVCGFTATPYRLHTGPVFGEGRPFSEMVYDADIRELIDAGYLSSLVSKDGDRPNLEGVGVRNGDFASDQLEAAMSDERTVNRAVDELIHFGADRKAWLVFCSGTKHARLVSNALAARGIVAPIVEGDTPIAERNRYIDDYRGRRLRVLVNINVLSVGFDAPHVDLICMLRPTLSPGLYYQQVGRGLRKADGKSNCLVLDLAGNIARHGPIDTLNQRIKAKRSAKDKGEAPTKTCPECKEIVHAGVKSCPSCGFTFPPVAIAKHSAVAAVASPLSSVKVEDVTRVHYYVNRSQLYPSDKPATLCVCYFRNMLELAREYLSIHPSSHPYAHNKALRWLYDTPKSLVDGRSLTIGGGVVTGTTQNGSKVIESAEELLEFAPCLATPKRISFRPNQKNPKYLDVISRVFKDDNE